MLDYRYSYCSFQTYLYDHGPLVFRGGRRPRRLRPLLVPGRAGARGGGAAGGTAVAQIGRRGGAQGRVGVLGAEGGGDGQALLQVALLLLQPAGVGLRLQLLLPELGLQEALLAVQVRGGRQRGGRLLVGGLEALQREGDKRDR